MTNFYTINYGSELLDGGKLSESIGSKCAAPSGQNDTMEEVKMKRSIDSKRPNVIGSKWPDDLTENTTEITTENKTLFVRKLRNRTRRRLNRIFNPELRRGCV